MGWSGGIFSRSFDWVTDKLTTPKISSTRHDTNDEELADGINACLPADGSKAMTGALNMNSHKVTNVTDGTDAGDAVNVGQLPAALASAIAALAALSNDIDMNSHKFTELSNGSARTDSISLGQVQDGAVVWAGTTTGSANAQAGTVSPTFSAYATGQRFVFKAGYSNTGSLTLDFNGKGAITVYKDVNGLRAVLGTSDIIANGIYEVVYDATPSAQFVLQTSKPGWGNFTHSFAPNAGSWSSLVADFKCAKNGQVMHVNFTSSGNQLTTPANSYTFSLPTALAIALSGLNVPVYISQGGTYEIGMMALGSSTATIGRTSGTFATGLVVISGSFSYFTD